MLLALQTFGEVATRGGVTQPPGETLRETVEMGVRAEAAGLHAFTVGEHHRVDYPVPSPEMVLAAVAARTERIRLGSAVTVLSTDDPVRVYERFAMLDGISGGRAEPMLGRGSFTETFSLYGFDLADYDRLFEERLELWSRLKSEGPVTWSGDTRPSLVDAQVFPRSSTPGGLTTWVGVGGNPQSVVRAAAYGYNVMLAGLGATPERIAQYVDLFDRALAEYGRPRPMVGLGITGYLADTDRQARDEAWEPYRHRMTTISRERGFAAPTRASYEQSIDRSLNLIGAPETVAERIADLARITRVDRIDFGMDTGGLPIETRHHAIDLLGREVGRRVRTTAAAPLAVTSA